MHTAVTQETADRGEKEGGRQAEREENWQTNMAGDAFGRDR